MDNITPPSQEERRAEPTPDFRPTRSELPHATDLAPSLVGPGWGRPVSELRPLWIAQLPAVHALAPYGNMRLERLFTTLPENPESDSLDTKFVEWGERSGLFENAPPDALAKIKMGHIVHWCTPMSSPQAQWNVGTFLMWMIALDDYWVEPGMELTDLKRACNDVLHSGESTLPLSPESRYFIELREELGQLGGEDLFTQIADEMQVLFLSNESEQRHNRNDTLPSLSGYLKQRARNGAVNGPLLAQRTDDGMLPPHRYFCERLVWIADLSTALSALDNDILGYQRDIEADYPVNIISVMSLEFRVDLATAYLMSLDLIELLKYIMDALVEDVCAFPGDYPEAAAQARSVAAWPHGWHTWTQNSPRYSVGALETPDVENACSESPPDQDWRTGPLLPALTGRDYGAEADAASATDWRARAMAAVAMLFGGLPRLRSATDGLTMLGAEPRDPAPRERTADELPDLPPSLTVRWEPYRNWSKTVEVDGVWVCEPRNTAEVVLLVNWAREQDFRVRASGSGYTFTPLTLTDKASGDRVILLDTRAHLNDLRMASGEPAQVKAGVGATMEALLTYLEEHGFGLATVPVTGEITLGGVLATGSHGSSVQVPGQIDPHGHSHGVLSNLVVSLTAVVWDGGRGEYVARTFERSHPDCAAFLVSLGRALLTEVTLRVGANQILRCISDVTNPATELFGPAEVPSPQRFASLVHHKGRVEAVWFPYNDCTWVRTWTPSTGPSSARPVTAPYNYPFMDSVPEPVSDVVAQIMNGAPELAPQLSDLEYTKIVMGLAASASADLVGPSKNVMLHLRSHTVRYVASGHAILTRRADLQRVVHDFAEFYRTRLREYQEQGHFPMNGPLHIRASSIDSAHRLGTPSASTPALSPIAPAQGQGEWDVAVWIGLLTLPGTPYGDQFYREFEEFLFTHYRPPYAMPRVEWSKAWGFSDDGPYRSGKMLRERVPSSFGDAWTSTRSTLKSYDPHGVFTNDFLEHLFASS